ncbi:MAG: hypothetical protein H0W64_11140 [Gammaproteobacteria bacterium]|nr:hypothetical protein [Gammaproteobacteria bacterium]
MQSHSNFLSDIANLNFDEVDWPVIYGDKYIFQSVRSTQADDNYSLRIYVTRPKEQSARLSQYLANCLKLDIGRTPFVLLWCLVDLKLTNNELVMACHKNNQLSAELFYKLMINLSQYKLRTSNTNTVQKREIAKKSLDWNQITYKLSQQNCPTGYGAMLIFEVPHYFTNETRLSLIKKIREKIRFKTQHIKIPKRTAAEITRAGQVVLLISNQLHINYINLLVTEFLEKNRSSGNTRLTNPMQLPITSHTTTSISSSPNHSTPGSDSCLVTNNTNTLSLSPTEHKDLREDKILSSKDPFDISLFPINFMDQSAPDYDLSITQETTPELLNQNLEVDGDPFALQTYSDQGTHAAPVTNQSTIQLDSGYHLFGTFKVIVKNQQAKKDNEPELSVEIIQKFNSNSNSQQC